MVLLIDNYDSFVHNLARYVRELGREAAVHRHDAISLDDIEALAPSHIILSPGPRAPEDAGISVDVVRRFGARIPILGVCLGHQCIAAAYGGDIVRAGKPVHGKTSTITHDGSSLFAGLPSPLRVARYHSLVSARASLPSSLRVVAVADDDGEIMAVEHREHRVIGVQFHPESAATEYGYAMLDRFLGGDAVSRRPVPVRADGWVRSSMWVNGRREEPDGCHVSARDRGVTLGDGVFETMRARGGTILRFDAHFARLAHGLDVLGIAAPASIRAWVIEALADAGGDDDLAIRLTVTRGVGAPGLAPMADSVPTVLVSVTPAPVFPASIHDVGLRAHIASGRRNERAMTAGLKTIAYTDAIVAWREAQRAGVDDAIFLDTDGHCSEALASNLFIWTGTTLLTPPRSCGVLPGITRAIVLELAGALGIPAAEQAFGPADLLAAQEAFLTSTLRGIAPLVSVGADPIGTGAVGPITRRCLEAYAALVMRECRPAAAGHD